MVYKINKYLNIYQWSFLLLTIISPLIVKCESDPDEFVPPLIYIQSRGYIGESHYITTDDGYILQVHRIISPKYLNVPRKAVLLQHGLLLSGMVFIINSPGGGEYFHGPVENHDPVNHYRSRHPEVGNNLGFLLADHGYDVWLANSRGNTYSTNHTKLSPFQDKKYWEFSFDEMALYDLPAVISHIQYVTGQKEIAYIGHSQGTAIAFVLLSERPQYASILKPVILLAPIMNISTTKDALRHVLTDEELMKDLLKVGGPLLPHASLLELFPEVVCATKLLYICENVLQIMGGLNVAQLNVTRLPVYFSYIPAGTSAKNFVHYKQMVLKGARYFDHGPEKNMAMYGRSEPPEFHFDRLDTSNMAMFWSENDLFCGAEEMDAVRRTLRRPPMAEYRIADPLWSHMDFLFGCQAGRFVNGPILGILKRYPISWLSGRGPQNHGSFSGHSNIPTPVRKPGQLINKPKNSRPYQPSLNG